MANEDNEQPMLQEIAGEVEKGLIPIDDEFIDEFISKLEFGEMDIITTGKANDQQQLRQLIETITACKGLSTEGGSKIFKALIEASRNKLLSNVIEKSLSELFSPHQADQVKDQKDENKDPNVGRDVIKEPAKSSDAIPPELDLLQRIQTMQTLIGDIFDPDNELNKWVKESKDQNAGKLEKFKVEFIKELKKSMPPKDIALFMALFQENISKENYLQDLFKSKPSIQALFSKNIDVLVQANDSFNAHSVELQNTVKEKEKQSKLFNVSHDEWANADKFFAEHPNAIKMSKKGETAESRAAYVEGDQTKHSFIKIDGKIYAMANGQWLGKGSFGRVKVVQTRNPESGQIEKYAIKIEKTNSAEIQGTELEVMKAINYLKGRTERELEVFKLLKSDMPQFIRNKMYTVTSLRSGKELFEVLNSPEGEKYTPTQRLLIAIKSMQAIKELHDRGIVHADIKPENFMVSVNGNNIVVSSIDFGLSKIIPRGKKSVNDEPGGTGEYMAPEILNGFEAGKNVDYTLSADMYSLAIMLNNDLNLANDIPELTSLIKQMLNTDPKERPNVATAIDKCISALENRPDLDSDAKVVLTQKENMLDKVLQVFNAYIAKSPDSDREIITERVSSVIPKILEDILNKVDLQSKTGCEEEDKEKTIALLTEYLTSDKVVDEHAKAMINQAVNLLIGPQIEPEKPVPSAAVVTKPLGKNILDNSIDTINFYVGKQEAVSKDEFMKEIQPIVAEINQLTKMKGPDEETKDHLIEYLEKFSTKNTSVKAMVKQILVYNLKKKVSHEPLSDSSDLAKNEVDQLFIEAIKILTSLPDEIPLLESEKEEVNKQLKNVIDVIKSLRNDDKWSTDDKKLALEVHLDSVQSGSDAEITNETVKEFARIAMTGLGFDFVEPIKERLSAPEIVLGNILDDLISRFNAFDETIPLAEKEKVRAEVESIVGDIDLSLLDKNLDLKHENELVLQMLKAIKIDNAYIKNHIAAVIEKYQPSVDIDEQKRIDDIFADESALQEDSHKDAMISLDELEAQLQIDKPISPPLDIAAKPVQAPIVSTFSLDDMIQNLSRFSGNDKQIKNIIADLEFKKSRPPFKNNVKTLLDSVFNDTKVDNKEARVYINTCLTSAGMSFQVQGRAEDLEALLALKEIEQPAREPAPALHPQMAPTTNIDEMIQELGKFAANDKQIKNIIADLEFKKGKPPFKNNVKALLDSVFNDTKVDNKDARVYINSCLTKAGMTVQVRGLLEEIFAEHAAVQTGEASIAEKKLTFDSILQDLNELSAQQAVAEKGAKPATPIRDNLISEVQTLQTLLMQSMDASGKSAYQQWVPNSKYAKSVSQFSQELVEQLSKIPVQGKSGRFDSMTEIYFAIKNMDTNDGVSIKNYFERHSEVKQLFNDNMDLLLSVNKEFGEVAGRKAVVTSEIQPVQQFSERALNKHFFVEAIKSIAPKNNKYTPLNNQRTIIVDALKNFQLEFGRLNKDYESLSDFKTGFLLKIDNILSDKKELKPIVEEEFKKLGVSLLTPAEISDAKKANEEKLAAAIVQQQKEKAAIPVRQVPFDKNFFEEANKILLERQRELFGDYKTAAQYRKLGDVIQMIRVFPNQAANQDELKNRFIEMLQKHCSADDETRKIVVETCHQIGFDLPPFPEPTAVVKPLKTTSVPKGKEESEDAMASIDELMTDLAEGNEIIAHKKGVIEKAKAPPVWEKLKDELMKKEPPEKNDYLKFDEKMLDQEISALYDRYKNASSAQRLVIPGLIANLEKSFYQAQQQVLTKYSKHEDKKVSSLKEDNDLLKEKANQAKLNKVNIKSTVKVNNDKIVANQKALEAKLKVLEQSKVQAQAIESAKVGPGVQAAVNQSKPSGPPIPPPMPPLTQPIGPIKMGKGKGKPVQQQQGIDLRELADHQLRHAQETEPTSVEPTQKGSLMSEIEQRAGRAKVNKEGASALAVDHRKIGRRQVETLLVHANRKEREVERELANLNEAKQLIMVYGGGPKGNVANFDLKGKGDDVAKQQALLIQEQEQRLQLLEQAIALQEQINAEKKPVSLVNPTVPVVLTPSPAVAPVPIVLPVIADQSGIPKPPSPPPKAPTPPPLPQSKDKKKGPGLKGEPGVKPSVAGPHDFSTSPLFQRLKQQSDQSDVAKKEEDKQTQIKAEALGKLKQEQRQKRVAELLVDTADVKLTEEDQVTDKLLDEQKNKLDKDKAGVGKATDPKIDALNYELVQARKLQERDKNLLIAQDKFLNNMLNINKSAIKNEYKAIDDAKENSLKNKIIKEQKKLGAKIFGKDKVRDNQLERIAAYFKDVSAMPTIDKESLLFKTKLSISFLRAIQKEIESEKNAYQSALHQLCEDKIKELESNIDDKSQLKKLGLDAATKYIPVKHNFKTLDENVVFIQNDCAKFNSKLFDASFHSQYMWKNQLEDLATKIDEFRANIQEYAKYGLGELQEKAFEALQKIEKLPEYRDFQKNRAEQLVPKSKVQVEPDRPEDGGAKKKKNR